MKVELPFPSSLLAGNGSALGGAQWKKIKTAKEHREWARLATRAVLGTEVLPDEGDVHILIRFIPPHNRGDRVGYPYRMKPYFDGIADALNINDKRFDPLFVFLAPEKPGRVEVYISYITHRIARNTPCGACGNVTAGVEQKRPEPLLETVSGPDQTLNRSARYVA